MRIVYGVHGYGRGHAMRALAVLPRLRERHELLILAGGDAYRTLRLAYPVLLIPRFCYHYNKRGKLSNYLNVKRNLPAVLDLLLQGPAFEMVAGVVRAFRPDVVVSDSEAFTHRIARSLRIPRITFDHFSLLVYCRLELSARDRLTRWGNTLAYRRLFGEPDRVIVSSFFDAPAARPGVCVVGPVIRDEVRRTEPTRGDHLLVYLSTGQHEYTPAIERALLGLDCPVRIYGTTEQGRLDNLEFKPLDNLAFIADLAGCRAIFATTGNQLLGEVIHFGKPILGMPIACLEQRLNADQLERLGIGMQVKRGQLTDDTLRTFLAREEEFVSNARRQARDGAREAVEAIERFAAELVSGQSAPAQ